MDTHHRHRHRHGWSELPGELLELILDHPTMEPLDLLRCRDVCRSWRSTVANRHQSKAHSLAGNTKIARGTDDDAAGQVYRLNLSNDNVYRLNLLIYNNAFVDGNGKRFVCGATSSRGWLLFEDLTTSEFISHFFLFNPFTGIKLDLPRTIFEQMYMSKSAMSASPRDPHCVIVLQSGIDFQFTYCHVGDALWRPIFVTELRHYDVIIYHRGRFYAVNRYDDCMLCFEFAADRDQPPTVTKIRPSCMEKDMSEEADQSGLGLSKYLVELPPCCCCCGDGSNTFDLVLVTRGSRWNPFQCDYDTKSGYDTTGFRVFRMDWITNTWREVNNFDCNNCVANKRKLALFLAHDESFFLCACASNQCKSNCIYFVGDSHRPFRSKGTDMGLFDLETKRIEPFYNSLFTRWFIPDVLI
ncbi:uncharacterized protein LOC131328761 [Rhododendron vialii]|uniref:uncharacterized protein LOC131328761 n=1 Tax=Rhododendron vialii TaxID=182163 RepID=UPI0026602B77|nr:uncharacterized protein LOC131328761 [Rhododendron vialii]